MYKKGANNFEILPSMLSVSYEGRGGALQRTKQSTYFPGRECVRVSGVLFLGRSLQCPFVAHLKIANWIDEYPFRVKTRAFIDTLMTIPMFQ